MRWPAHNEPVRDDELYLFAYCGRRWGDTAYVQRPAQSYADVAVRLNIQFGERFGHYSEDAIETYLRRLRMDVKYRWPATSQKRYNQFAAEIDRYRRENGRLLGPGPLPPAPIGIGSKGTRWPRTSLESSAGTRCIRLETLPVRDVVARLKALEDGERVTLLAEFADAFGPLLTRTLRSRKPKYEAELMNRLLAAAVAIFGNEQHTMEVLRRTRFFSKASKPQRRCARPCSRTHQR
jgi:hypothetical protein